MILRHHTLPVVLSTKKVLPSPPSPPVTTENLFGPVPNLVVVAVDVGVGVPTLY